MAASTGYAVATVNDLKAIGSDVRVDGYIKSVTAKDSWYIFRASSSDIADDDLVIQPTSGTGRWIKMYTDIDITSLYYSALPVEEVITTVNTGNISTGVNYTGYSSFPALYLITNVETDFPARIRLYLNEAYADADIDREVTEEVSGEHGCLLECVTSTSNLSLSLSPTIFTYTINEPSQLYVVIGNNDSVTRDIELTITGKTYNNNGSGSSGVDILSVFLFN